MSLITEEAYKEMEARALEAEANLIRAAEAGNQLVNKLHESKAARDSIFQERHELKLALENKIALTMALEEEVENYKESSEKKEKKHCEIVSKLLSDFEAKEKAWKVKEQTLEKTADQLQMELEAAKRKILFLEDSASTTADNRNLSIVSDDGASLLQEELDQYKKKFSEMKGHNTELMQNNEELSLQVENLRRSVQELKEAIEEKDAEMAGCMATMGQEMNYLLPLDQEDEVPEEDLGLAKGNSLFSEVDDRRLLVEDQLKKYKSRCEELKTSCQIKSSQVAKLRAQNVALLNMASSGGSESSAISHRLEELLNMEKNQNLKLLARITELEEILEESGTTAFATSNRRETVFPVNRRETAFAGARRETVFFAEQNGQSRPTGETDLGKRLRSQIRQTLEREEKIHELTKELNNLEKNHSNLKAENYQLKTKIQRIAERTPSVTTELMNSRPKRATAYEKGKTEILVFSPESKNLKVEEPPKFVLNEINSNPMADDVFSDFKVRKAVPEVVVKKEKLSFREKSVRKGVTFSVTENAEVAGPKIEVKENNDPESPSSKVGSASNEKLSAKEKRIKESKIVDAAEEIKKMESENPECVQQ